MRLLRDSRGQVFVLGALLMVVLLGFAGLTVDVGISYVQYREAQSAADSAALAAADDLPDHVANAPGDAAAIAATVNQPSHGFVDGQNNTTVAVTTPYSGGPPGCQGTPASCVQVTIKRRVATYFLKALGFTGIDVSRSAVAMTGTTNQLPCTICVLNPKATGALADSGNGNISVSNGNIVVNSSASGALQISGNGSINAGGGGTIGVVGGFSNSGNGATNPPVQTGVSAVPDPLANVPYPPLGGYTSCPSISLSGNNSQTIGPGCYQDLNVSGNGSLTLQAGLYVITGSVNMSGNGGSGVSGTAGVTFFLTCGGATPALCISGQAGGGLNISGNGAFTSPGNGLYQGMVFFFDRNNISGINLSGNGGNNITGTVYGKSATMNISGNGGTYNTNALIVVDRIQMSGNGGIVDNFDQNQNYKPTIRGASKLVQ